MMSMITSSLAGMLAIIAIPETLKVIKFSVFYTYLIINRKLIIFRNVEILYVCVCIKKDLLFSCFQSYYNSKIKMRY